MNSYQRRKARLIAGTLLLAAIASEIPTSQLPVLVAKMSHREWVTVSLQAGVPVAEHAARVLVVAYLQRLA